MSVENCWLQSVVPCFNWIDTYNNSSFFNQNEIRKEINDGTVANELNWSAIWFLFLMYDKPSSNYAQYAHN